MQEVYPGTLCSPSSQHLTSALYSHAACGSLGKYSNKFKDDQIVVRTTALDPTCHRRGEIQTKATLRCGGGAHLLANNRIAIFFLKTASPSSAHPTGAETRRTKPCLNSGGVCMLVTGIDTISRAV